jgi:hypothetical protein
MESDVLAEAIRIVAFQTTNSIGFRNREHFTPINDRLFTFVCTLVSQASSVDSQNKLTRVDISHYLLLLSRRLPTRKPVCTAATGHIRLLHAGNRKSADTLAEPPLQPEDQGI